MLSAFPITPQSKTPQNVPSAFPFPPDIGVPPITTEPIACSSIPVPRETEDRSTADERRFTRIKANNSQQGHKGHKEKVKFELAANRRRQGYVGQERHKKGTANGHQ